MTYFIDDTNQHQITITDLWREWVIPKFRINMVVSEPYLSIYWNDRESGTGGDERVLKINYLDVADGYSGYADNPASATALMAMIDAMIVSGFGSTGDLLTAKADLLSHDGVSDTILPGGTNEYVLSRDNSTQTGLKWIAQSSANVVGAASSVDDRIVTFDGTTGKLIQDGGYTIAQLLAKIPTTYDITGNQTLTGTVAQTVMATHLIPANTIGLNDTLELYTMIRNTSGAGTFGLYCYINTVATIYINGLQPHPVCRHVLALLERFRWVSSMGNRRG